MDLNSKINWTEGMELTARTFIGMEQQLDARQQIALRMATGSCLAGMIPGTEFQCSGIFVGSTYEIERLQCTALLPSGRIVCADEKAEIPIPMLFGSEYYLTVAIGISQIEFEKEGVPYVRHQYVYTIQTLDETKNSDVVPIMKFVAKQGVLSVDPDYIKPCLMVADNPVFADYIQKYIDILTTITSHANLEDGDGKRAMLRYLFQMKSYSMRHSVNDLILFTQEMVQAIDYYIVTPNQTTKMEIPQPENNDIRLWLNWVESCLQGAVDILDKVVLEDNTIDYDALLAQAKKELYGRLQPELLENLAEKLKKDVQQEIDDLTQVVSSYMRETLKDELLAQVATDSETRSALLDTKLAEGMDKMNKELSKTLYDKMFPEIYMGVYNVLHEEEIDDFVPLI
ncbi:MAG: hypothetical protein K6F33_08620 [Bacteroidales bacterium]|nr:hypothetical protein [Bacteroidales bacterium]